MGRRRQLQVRLLVHRLFGDWLWYGNIATPEKSPLSAERRPGFERHGYRDCGWLLLFKTPMSPVIGLAYWPDH